MNLPPILQQLQSNIPGLGQIRQLMQTVRMAANPQAAMQQMMQNNPQMSQVMQLVSQHGGDAKKAFYALAQQKGVNPDEILNMLR